MSQYLFCGQRRLPLGSSSGRFSRSTFDGAGTGLRRGSERGPAGIGVDGLTVFVCRAATAPTGCQHALYQWNTEQGRASLGTFERLKRGQPNSPIAAKGELADGQQTGFGHPRTRWAVFWCVNDPDAFDSGRLLHQNVLQEPWINAVALPFRERGKVP